MSFLKETNYHGSRTYDGDPADQGRMDFGLRWSLAFAWTALQLKKFGRLLLAAVQPTPRAERGFTLLGTEQRTVPVHRPISDLFPIGASNEHASRIRHEN